ncbi:MAG: hypothetical protein RL217_943 [Pseudomonadota bacterium]|jgi:peptide/nickel transport system ATP-binding protein
MNELLLKVENLQVAANEPLLKGLSFHIQAGEILALVGGSGSGKSLTALAIMRLLGNALHIRAGQVKLAGQDLFSLTEAQMNKVRGKDIAMVFQEPQTALNPVKTVGQQIAEALILHRKLTGAALSEQVLALLNEVGIPDAKHRQHWFAHQLSGGQKQRIVIAMALACEPKLLIADEPTTALDVTIQKQILTLLNQIKQKRQLAILFITHDMGVVAEMADRVAVMQQGEIVEQNSVVDFFRAPKHPYSQELLAFIPKHQPYLTPTQAEPLLEIRQAQIYFPKKTGLFSRQKDYTRAVDRVDLTLYKGETLALVGESGSGKSTLGRGILKLEKLHGGEIYFAGKNIGALSAAQFLPLRKKIQIIFQDPFSSMNPRFSVRDILTEGMQALGVGKNQKEREQRAGALLERVGLKIEHLNRYPHEFSGGQRQRIAIARALAVEPELIICDEPTSALDLSLRGQVLSLLKELQEEMGMAYLFITHDLSIISQIAQRVAVMKNGKIIEQGSCAQVLENPTQAYTQELLAARPKYELG